MKRCSGRIGGGLATRRSTVAFADTLLHFVTPGLVPGVNEDVDRRNTYGDDGLGITGRA
jgi:hypothetical protein